MKSRYNILEKTVKDLQSISETHQRFLDTVRTHVVDDKWKKGELDLTYQQERFDVMQ